MTEIVLLSGGLDSALAWHRARLYGPATGIFYQYGQKHMGQERAAMEAFARAHDIPVEIHHLPSLAKSDSVVFVGRNLLMLAATIPHAHRLGAKRIWIGCNASDHERFKDCRPDFLRAADQCANAYGVMVMAPLQNMTKKQVISELVGCGENPDALWSCYNPRDNAPCGECLACRTRAT